jgi:hypothetical protein
MKTWFSSHNGAITLSAVALVAFIARSLLDFQFVMPEFFSAMGQVAVSIVIYMAFFGGWLWGLLAAVQGSRRGMIAALIFPMLFGVGLGIGTLVSFCPSPCATAGGLMEITNWTNLITGLLAVIAIASRLRLIAPKRR